MRDYRETKYCKSLTGILERKNKVKEQVLVDHPRAKDMHAYVSKNKKRYKKIFMEAYNYKCAYCGVSIDLLPMDSFEIDHFINREAERFATKAEAGTIENLVLACHDCNHSKNDFSIATEYELDLNPDEQGITLNFQRDDLFRIELTQQGKEKQHVQGFYETLRFGNEMRRIDYLVLSMIGLQRALKDKGKDYKELAIAINVLKTKRNLMSLYSKEKDAL